jgi:hypothetical protein
VETGPKTTDEAERRLAIEQCNAVAELAMALGRAFGSLATTLEALPGDDPRIGEALVQSKALLANMMRILTHCGVSPRAILLHQDYLGDDPQ